MRGLAWLIGIAALPAGCVLGAFEADRDDPTTKGTGGEGGGGGSVASAGQGGASAASAGSGGVGVTCDAPEQCPMPPSLRCATATCAGGQCGFVSSPGGLAPGQTMYDCTALYCDGAGNEFPQLDPGDIVDDVNPCTDNVCDVTGPTYPYTAAFKACPDGLCNGAGFCVPKSCAEGSCGPTPDCVTVECSSQMCLMTSRPPGTYCVNYSGVESKCDGAGNCL